MTKLLKILRNFLLFLVEYSLIIVIFLSFAIRTSSFQTYVGDRTVNYFSKTLDLPLQIGKIDISFFDRAYIDKVFIPDKEGDTLLYIRELYVNLGDYDLKKLKFDIDEVKLTGANVELKKYIGKDHLNFQFLVDHFKSDEPSEETDFEINLTQLNIESSRFSFNDLNKKMLDYGVDYSHLGLRKIALKASNIKITPESYIADIKRLKAKERSGFKINEMLAAASFDSKGVKLSNTKIKTSRSDIDLPSFELKTKDLSDFSSFVNKVRMKSKLINSKVSLADVSLFAPQLKGMNDVVTISCNTNNVINDLLVKNLKLRYKERTEVRGDFRLIDFSNILSKDLDQRIATIAIDSREIAQLKLPESAGMDYLDLPESLRTLDYVRLNKIDIKGKLQNVELNVETMTTNLGEIYWRVPMKIKSDSTFSRIEVKPKVKVNKSLVFNDIEVDRFLNNDQLGKLDGGIQFTRLLYDNKVLSVEHVRGTFNDFNLANYPYSFIVLDDVYYELDNRSYTPKNEVKGKIYVRDENLDLTFDGLASVGNELIMNANLDLECAHLEALNPAFKNRGDVYTSLRIDAKGKDFETFKGDLNIDTLFYAENGNDFHTTNFKGTMERSKRVDKLYLESDWLDADVMGNMEFDLIAKNVVAELNKIFPAFVPAEEKSVVDSSHFDYSFNIKDINPILDVVYPSLHVAKNTQIDGRYVGKNGEMSMNIESDYVSYDSTRIQNISIIQDVYNRELLALYRADAIYFNDSLTFEEIHFTGLTAKGFMDSQLIFHDTKDNRSNLEWYTHLFDKDGFDIDILPSYFTVNGHKWQLEDRAHLNYTDNCFFLEDFKLEYNDQYISAEGQMSKYPFDKLYLDIMNVDLKDIGVLLGQDFDLSGKANAAGSISTPFTDFKFVGDAVLEDLYVNETELGNVSFGADYNAKLDRVSMFGDIIYKKKRTFAFDGNYLLNPKSESDQTLDFNMLMRGTDISVVSEFLDPEVVRTLEGKLQGDLSLTGTVAEPLLKGKVDMNDGKVNLAILGADMFFSGEVESVKDGFYINSMPLEDEEGNVGFITGSLFHDNFENFFFEINANLEEHPTKRMPNNPAKALPVDRFLVMDTEYSEDEPYHGTAYINGIANISGYADNLSIDVSATTKKGTAIFFPMYGPTTIEEEGFISFKTSEDETEQEKKVDLTGVDFNFDFNVTNDAQVKLIFDENIGDEITARGTGDLNMGVDQYGELTLKGTYTVVDGMYNFAMGPYKQNFVIEEGGTVQWTGDPYEAVLDINTYYETQANLAIVMPDVVENSSADNELIKSYLYLDGNMMSPEISFDLEAPNASESGKAVISRIRSDQDELNKQFFSILVSRSFLPLAGQESGAGSSGGALLDLASTQINSLLNKVSQNYQMNVNLENDNLLGGVTGQFGLSKNFLNDRLQVSGSVGVGSIRDETEQSTGAPGHNTIIGDVEVEYLLNEDGTFRVSAFNESNNNTVIQNNTQGQFTQGVGVSYKEDFHTLEDFKLFQFFANLFRKKEKKKDLPRDEDKRVPIPAEYLEENAVKEEE
tara:strand:+ start:1763 stop:6385 length:4623 start_codon:yes stop_codon:yes gene_type:complete